MYYRIIKGKLCPAPRNIQKLIGNPTKRQYLFFGYKPLEEEEDSEGSENGEYTYVEEETVIRKIPAHK